MAARTVCRCGFEAKPKIRCKALCEAFTALKVSSHIPHGLNSNKFPTVAIAGIFALVAGSPRKRKPTARSAFHARTCDWLRFFSPTVESRIRLHDRREWRV